jgi:protein-S-isoprenylcysteine O-methyltransferase Ste14
LAMLFGAGIAVMAVYRLTIVLIHYTERYGLSVLYLWLAAKECHSIWGILSGQSGTGSAVLVDAGRHLTVLLLTLFTSLLLLLGRRADVPPEKLKFILIPLATTFFNLNYIYVVPLFPKSLQANLFPAALQTPMFIAGLTCIVIGPLIALWGLIYLGRSFGIFVTVRKVVLTGPYQWVRHPMYLGWVCSCFGVGIANFSVAYLLLVAMHISLLLYRAHLEETQLAEHSPEYRENMKRTGFIFPKFRRPPANLLKAE